MALELITGRAGKAHVGSEDVRAYNAQTAGGGRYVLDGGETTIQSANQVKIAPAEILVDGAHVRITGTGEVVTIDNGASSYKRVDIIALHYKRTGGEDDAIETMELVAVKGTPADDSPADPEMPATGSILDNVAETYIPYARVLIDGLTPQTPTVLLDQYALPPEHGGTGLKASPSMLVNLASASADDVLKASPRPGVTGTLPASHGGTGQTSLQATRNAMGLGNTTGALPVANGGTGQTTLQATRNAMGLGNTTGALPVANGGTGMTANPSMLTNLGSTAAAGVFQTSPRPGITGTLPVSHGGTGMTATTSGTFTGGAWRRLGNVVNVTINTTTNLSGSWSDVTLGTIPSGSRPSAVVIFPVLVENLGTSVRGIVNVDGSVHLIGVGGSAAGGNGKYGACAYVI